MKYVEPLPLYVIHEEVYAAVFGISKVTVNGRSILGATLDKISRRVYQVTATKEIYQGGAQIETPGLWEIIKDATGYEEFEERFTGEKGYLLAYAGYINEVEAFGYRGRLPRITSPFNFGTDPIPRQLLVGNARITFEVPQGARGRVSAMAMYDGVSQQLKPFSQAKREEVMNCLLKVPRQDGSPQVCVPAG